jgi:hypothetical protein
MRQGQLLPAFVDDALDSSDPMFFIEDVVEGWDLTARCRGSRAGIKPARGLFRPHRINCCSRGPCLPRQLCWRRHAGRACHQPFQSRLRSRPEMHLGSAS